MEPTWRDKEYLIESLKRNGIYKCEILTCIFKKSCLIGFVYEEEMVFIVAHSGCDFAGNSNYIFSTAF